MAAGDVFIVGPTSTSDTSFFDVQPGVGEEVVIHNIYIAGSCELYFYDGTNSILVDSITGNGGWLDYAFHCTNSKRLRVKNVSGGAIFIAADGMVTK